MIETPPGRGRSREPARAQIRDAAAAHGWTVTTDSAERLEFQWKSRPGHRYRLEVDFGATGQLRAAVIGGGRPLLGLHFTSLLDSIIDAMERQARTFRRQWPEAGQ